MLRSENSHFLESLRGMASIKALAIGDRRQGIWNNYLVDRVAAELRVGKIDLIFTIVSTLLFGLDRVVIIFFGARAVMGGTLSVGMLVAFLAYKDQFSARVGRLLDTLVQPGHVDGAWRADCGHCARRTGAERFQPSCCGRDDNQPQGRAQREGDQLSLQRQRTEVIARFRSRCRAGECVAIAGPSALARRRCSRSSLACCARLPAQCSSTTCRCRRSGSTPIAPRSAACCRTTGCSPARLPRTSPALAHRPIRSGSSRWRGSRPSTMRSCTCRWATRHWWAIWAARSRAGRCSASCWRARSIARPRILLLDEATSHLDEENERAINTAIRRLPISRVIVAHRRSTLDMADRIVPIWPSMVDGRFRPRLEVSD